MRDFPVNLPWLAFWVMFLGGLLAGCTAWDDIHEFDATYGAQFNQDMAGLRAGTTSARSGWERTYPSGYGYGSSRPTNCYSQPLMNGGVVTNCF
jgi:hypothetical protein